jgi:hypothetical protein
MDIYTTWIGYGVKIGGSLAIIGAETTDGKVCNLGYTTEVYPFNISSLRLGPGIGGAVGTVGIFVFNCVNIQDMSDTKTSDWALNFSLGGKWSEIAKGIKRRRLYKALAKTMGDLTNASPSDVTTIRNTASYMYSAVEAEGMMPGTPSAIVLDIPAGGIGVEVSLSKLYGIITVGDLITPISAEESASWTEGGSGSGPGT